MFLLKWVFHSYVFLVNPYMTFSINKTLIVLYKKNYFFYNNQYNSSNVVLGRIHQSMILYTRLFYLLGYLISQISIPFIYYVGLLQNKF